MTKVKNSEEYIAYIKELLIPFGEFELKKMFGSIGIFKDGICFAGIMENTFRLKVDDTNRDEYEAKGMGPWQVPGKKMKMSYYQVPIEVMEDSKVLVEWANRSFELAKRKKK